MAVLSIYLSPFAPDYSGVSSVLFDLHTVTAMHDASGCTGNYTGYDEPKMASISRKPEQKIGDFEPYHLGSS